MPSFTPETVRFLADLRENNSKPWFDENRARYEAHFLAPARAFIEELAAPLRELSEGLHAASGPSGSLMRIHRDTRFAADKRPYKDHLDLMFWEGEGRPRECPGLFFRISPDGLYLGGGLHGFDKARMAAYREAVFGEPGERLQGIVDEVRAHGFVVGGQKFAKVPRGLPADHPRAALLRHDGLHAFIDLEPVPDVAFGPELTTLVMSRFERVHPLVAWLVEVLRP